MNRWLVWWALLGILRSVCLMDGFDLGAAMLLPSGEMTTSVAVVIVP